MMKRFTKVQKVNALVKSICERDEKIAELECGIRQLEGELKKARAKAKLNETAAETLSAELYEKQLQADNENRYCEDEDYYTDCGPVDDTVREYKSLPEWKEIRESEKKYGAAWYKCGYFVFLEDGKSYFDSEHEEAEFFEKDIPVEGSYASRFKARAVCVYDELEYDTIFVKYGNGRRTILSVERRAENNEKY